MRRQATAFERMKSSHVRGQRDTVGACARSRRCYRCAVRACAGGCGGGSSSERQAATPGSGGDPRTTAAVSLVGARTSARRSRARPSTASRSRSPTTAAGPCSSTSGRPGEERARARRSPTQTFQRSTRRSRTSGIDVADTPDEGRAFVDRYELDVALDPGPRTRARPRARGRLPAALHPRRPERRHRGRRRRVAATRRSGTAMLAQLP